MQTKISMDELVDILLIGFCLGAPVAVGYILAQL